MRKRIIIFLLLTFLFTSLTTSAYAQGYYFELPQLTIHAYWNSDGTLSLDYTYYFQNDPNGHPIEYVDLGLPNSTFDETSISADVDGNPVFDISAAGFQGEGTDGVAIGLGSYTISPGESGTVHIYVGKIWDVLHQDSNDSNYASAFLIPSYFVSDIIYGITDYSLTYHLPPGVKPEEPRYHDAPDDFPEVPDSGFDEEGRIIYVWQNPTANGYTTYGFGASFPKQYVPDTAIVRSNPFAFISRIESDSILPFFCCGSLLIMALWSIFSSNRRKLQYLPPKISIEGHGIKRGLTAVEASILLEEPLEKVMTMILFSTIKKGAAQVKSRDPLELILTDPLPQDLNEYEKNFLNSFRESGVKRQRELQDTIIALVKSISQKMKGFSRKETIAYYQDIMKRAWQQVEAADTPEVKSQKFDEVIEWTMLDDDWDDHTKRVFRDTPIFIPTWWGHYDPSFRGGASSKSVSLPTGRPATSGGSPMPTLPGSAFAASVVTGVQTFSTRVVGNITDFTSGVASKTNPIPKSSSSGTSWKSGGGSSGSSGHSCACACACAGCACACAGGGR